MKLSILIPVYNFDCRRLVADLLRQLPPDSEMVVADDCSTDGATSATMEEMAGWENCRVWRAPQNMGRSRIRNRLAELARGEWLLYMDCDAEVSSPTFLTDYMLQTEGHDVVCGGTGNMERCPSPKVILRYKYEKAAESRLTLDRRREMPYAQFTTFNFMIRREVLMSIRFDESIQGYGHEDTLLGLELERRGIGIHHIENKATHLGLEDAATYLRKMEEAAATLAAASDESKTSTRLGRTLLWLKKRHLATPVAMAFRMLRPAITWNLKGTHPSLTLLNVYKIGWACVNENENGDL